MKKIIKIKRNHIKGLKPCSGELIERYGMQFCLTKIKSLQVYYLIELETSCSALVLDARFYTIKAARIAVESLFDKKSAEDFIKAKLRCVFENNARVEFPVNQPV